uniref:DUF6534 domain-containing protein n=1 Tax=Moniliophthora roreri TaxID=221103 RepID=A0A0W0G5Z1_MONRR
MPDLQPDLGDTFGAILVATVISSCLYGVTCLQTWYYFRNYSDSILIRGVVLVILALETIHAVFITHAMYYYLILNYGNSSALLTHIWSTIGIVPLTSAIRSLVHLFYAIRVYLLSRKRDWWTPTIVCILNAAQVALSITATVETAQSPYFAVTDHSKEFLIIGILPLFFTAAGDIVCAVALSYYLHSNRSGIKSTDTRINKLIVHAVNNGVLTVVAIILVIIFIITKPRNLLYEAVLQVIGNLYANSLLSTLNSRKTHMQTALPISVDSSHLRFGSRHLSEMLHSIHPTDTSTIDIEMISHEPESDAQHGQEDAVGVFLYKSS